MMLSNSHRSEEYLSPCQTSIMEFFASFTKTLSYMLTGSYRSSRPEVFYKIGFLKNFFKFTGKHQCQASTCNFIKKETLAHVFSCEF